jgi:hypothetical protein
VDVVSKIPVSRVHHRVVMSGAHPEA